MLSYHFWQVANFQRLEQKQLGFVQGLQFIFHLYLFGNNLDIEQLLRILQI
jgi:hypothetical protein